MVDDALHVRPRGECERKCMVGIPVGRALQKLERARISLGVKREDTRHCPERKIVRAQVGIRFPRGAIDLRKKHARPQRRGNSHGEMLLGRRVAIAECAVGAMCPKMTAGFGLDQSQGQARLPGRPPHDAGQMVARRSRLTRDRSA
jgi:hypothetical protein